MITIDVGKDFSKTPFGRYKTDGEYSAEKFREEVLLPKLLIEENILVDFSNVALGVGSSFLEEVFGGLVRKGYDKEELLKKIQVTDTMGFYSKQVIRYIEIAQKQC